MKIKLSENASKKVKYCVIKIIFLLTMLDSQTVCADVNSIVWKGTYYNTAPNQTGITQQYCEEHLPGTFIHSINTVISHGITTNRGIHLDHATFHEKNLHGVYIINGGLYVHGVTNGQQWDDHIFYYLYKLSEYGETRGVWSSEKCKGLYLGNIINQ